MTVYRRKQWRWGQRPAEEETKQDRATKSPSGRSSPTLSSVFVRLKIINSLKDSMKLEQTRRCGSLINSLKRIAAAILSEVCFQQVHPASVVSLPV